MARTSDKGQKILEFVNGFVRDNGYAPSVREIGAAVGLNSTASVSYQLHRLQEQGATAELARLQEKRFIGEADAKLVRLPEVEAFRRSPLLAALTEQGATLWRELRFHVRLPAAAFTMEAERKSALQSETVLVQGVMDAVLRRADGSLWLIDYKTDRLTQAEKQNRPAAEEKLRARHGLQLSYYAEACRRMFGKLPDRVLLYSLALGDVVEVPIITPFSEE